MEKLKTIQRVMIVGRFGPPLLAFARSCKCQGIKVYLVEVSKTPVQTRSLSSCLEDGFVLDPDLVETDAGIKSIKEFSQKTKVEALIGSSERTILWLARNRSSFEPQCKVLAPDVECLETLAEKTKQIEVAQKAGFELLPTTYLHSPADVDQISKEFFPVCIRPSNPIGIEPELKAKVFYDQPSLKKFLEELTLFDQTIVVQPFFNQPDLKVHGAVSAQGEILAMECFYVLRKFEGVTLSLKRMEFPLGIEEACRKFAKLSGIKGCFHFDLLYLKNEDKAKYLEINARLGGVTDKSMVLGYDQPALFLQCFGLRGGHQVQRKCKEKSIVVNKKAVLKHIVTALKGELTELDYPPASRLTHARYSLKDLIFANDSVFDWHDLKGTLWFYFR